MIKAFLFDLDGTLLDTERILFRCWKISSREYGHELADEEAWSLRSLGRPFAAPHAEELMDHRCTYTELRGRRMELFEEVIAREGIPVKPGAETLLKWLKDKGIITAIVTASAPDYARRHLGNAGLLSYFDHILSATEVPQGKPAPDVYLTACRTLGLSPSQCIAVEDSPNGIRSAHAAGCSVIMVPDLTGLTEDLKPMLLHCVDRLDEIICRIDL